MAKLRVPRFRLLPVMIFVAVLMLSVRLNDVWQGVGEGFTVGSGEVKKASEALLKSASRESGPLVNAPVVIGETEALAQDTGAETSAAGETDAEADAVTDLEVPAAAFGEPSAYTQSEIEILEKLAERRETIENREASLAQREALLQAAEAQIDRKVARLQELQAEIQTLVEQHDAQQEEKIDNLVRIYSAMKPKDAARIFNELDLPILTTVVELMKERTAAAIIAEMESDRAKILTTELAERQELPGSEMMDGATFPLQ